MSECDEAAGFEEAAKIGKYKLGTWGCLCDTLAHKLVGDGCEMCNPERAKELAEEDENQ